MRATGPRCGSRKWSTSRTRFWLLICWALWLCHCRASKIRRLGLRYLPLSLPLESWRYRAAWWWPWRREYLFTRSFIAWWELFALLFMSISEPVSIFQSVWIKKSFDSICGGNILDTKGFSWGTKSQLQLFVLWCLLVTAPFFLLRNLIEKPIMFLHLPLPMKRNTEKSIVKKKENKFHRKRPLQRTR